jgi:membrane protein implicated in regulation of membrane protease activity
MSTSSDQKTGSLVTKRRLGLAGLAAIAACAACCAIPMVAAALLGGGAAATVSSVFSPGAELVAAAVVFVAVLAVLALRSRSRSKRATACEGSCSAGAECCDGRATRSAS